MTKEERLSTLSSRLGIGAQDAALYIEALTHGSGNGRDYQRLEFLGDRVLGLCIADMLYQRFPDEPEGMLSPRLNVLVSGEICAEIARENQLGELLILGKQAHDDGGRDSANILGDVVESLIGAVYIDRGLDKAKELIARLWGDRITAQHSAPRHPKSALQEWAAANDRKPPEYRVTDRGGPAHAPHFTVEVSIPNLAKASGDGSSKQEAQKAAAHALLQLIDPETTS